MTRMWTERWARMYLAMHPATELVREVPATLMVATLFAVGSCVGLLRRPIQL